MEAPLALYRRYRPETFAEVIGQDHVTAPLRNALSNNRVNHAYLFSGPRGCGKTTSARILARAINCEKGPIAEPCGVCKSCTDLARGGPGSIDVIEIDAASHGGVDDARDLRERAFFAPVESRYKIYIIDEAHMVTTQGFNALLKLVEEPPPHLKFIFATTEPDKVIGTIRSRTHHYPFRLVPPKVLADYMAQLCESEGVAIESAALPLVVRAGAGSVRDSLSVLDQLIGGAGPEGVTYELAVALLGFTPDSLLDACVDGFAAHDSAAVFETIEKVIETGQDPKRFAEDLLRRLRDLVVLSAVPNAITSGLIEAAEDQGERLQTQAAGIGAAELTRAADIVAAGLLEMRGATAPRLQLELICAKVLLPGADDSTNGIQARLDRMERRLTIGVPSSTPDSTPTSANVDALSGRASARAASSRGTSPSGALGAPAADSAGPSAPSTDAGQGAAGAGGDGAADAGGEGAARAGRDGARSGTASRAGAGSGHRADGATSGADRTADVTGTGSGRSAAGADAGVGRAGAGTDAGAGRAAAGAGAGSGAGRTGAWGDESAAAGGASGATDGAEQTAGTSGSAGTGPSAGSVGLADIRRLWPEVLEAVKSKRRFAWIMLSQNAQVIAIDDQTLTLGLVNAGARESFARSGSDEILRQAMIDTIGLNRRVEAVVDPSADPGAGGQHTGGPRSGAPRSGGPSAGGASPAGAGTPADPGGRSDASGPGGGVGPGGAGGSGGASGAGSSGEASGPVADASVSAGPGVGGSATGGPGVGGSVSGSPGAGGSDSGGPGAGAAGGPGGGAPGTGGSGSGGPGAGGADGPGARGAATGGAAGAGASDQAAGGSAVAGASGQDTGGAANSPRSSNPSTAGARTGSWGAGEVGGSGGGGARSGPWREGAAVVMEEPPDSEYDVPPEPDPWDEGPGPAVSKRRAAEAAVAAEQARRAAAAPVKPVVPLTPEEEAAEVGDDDMVLEEDSQSHTDLLRETLGAQIITEEPN